MPKNEQQPGGKVVIDLEYLNEDLLRKAAEAYKLTRALTDAIKDAKPKALAAAYAQAKIDCPDGNIRVGVAHMPVLLFALREWEYNKLPGKPYAAVVRALVGLGEEPKQAPGKRVDMPNALLWSGSPLAYCEQFKFNEGKQALLAGMQQRSP